MTCRSADHNRFAELSAAACLTMLMRPATNLYSMFLLCRQSEEHQCVSSLRAPRLGGSGKTCEFRKSKSGFIAPGLNISKKLACGVLVL